MSIMFDDFKEQVRSQANIVDIVSEYVPLKKRGSSYWGCCPFHGEKTPSFSVSPDKNFFYCFGCHAGGDIFIGQQTWHTHPGARKNKTGN